MRPKNSKLRKSYMPDFGLACGRSFRAVLEETQKKISKEPQGSGDYVVISDMVVYATNLIFATETYLKTMLALDGKPIPDHHNLWGIFNAISKDNRDVIEKRYNYEYGISKTKPNFEPIFLVSKAPYSEERFLEAAKNIYKKHDSSIKSVLEIAGRSYNAWRYVPQTVWDEDYLLALPRPQLICLCDALDHLISDALKRRAESKRPTKHA